MLRWVWWELYLFMKISMRRVFSSHSPHAIAMWFHLHLVLKRFLVSSGLWVAGAKESKKVTFHRPLNNSGYSWRKTPGFCFRACLPLLWMLPVFPIKTRGKIQENTLAFLLVVIANPSESSELRCLVWVQWDSSSACSWAELWLCLHSFVCWEFVNQKIRMGFF